MAKMQVFDGVFRRHTLPDPGIFNENIILFPTIEQDGTRKSPVTVYGFIEAVEADSRDFENMYGLLSGENRVVGSVDYLRKITFVLEGFDPYNYQTLKIPSFAWRNFAWDVIAHEQPYGTGTPIHTVFAALGFEDPEDAANNRFGGWDRARIGVAPEAATPPAGQPGNSPGETIVNPPAIVVPPSFSGPANEYGSWPHPTVMGFTAVYRRRILAGLPRYHDDYDTLWWMDGAWRYYLEDRTIPPDEQPVPPSPIVPAGPGTIDAPGFLVRPGETHGAQYADPYNGWVLRTPVTGFQPQYRWRSPHDEANVDNWNYFNYDPFVNPSGVTTHFENIGGVFYSYNVDDNKPYWICSVPVTQVNNVPHRGTEGENVFVWDGNAYFLFDPQYAVDAPEQANTSITLYPPLDRELDTPAPASTAFYLYPEITSNSIITGITNRSEVLALESSGWAFRDPAVQPITGVTHETRVIVPQVGTQVAVVVELERIMKIYHPNGEVTPHANSYYFEYNPLGNFQEPSQLPLNGGVPPSEDMTSPGDGGSGGGTTVTPGAHGFFYEMFNMSDDVAGTPFFENLQPQDVADDFIDNTINDTHGITISANPQTHQFTSNYSFQWRARIQASYADSASTQYLRDVMRKYYPGADYAASTGTIALFEHNPFGFFPNRSDLAGIPTADLVLPEDWTVESGSGTPPVAPEPEDDGQDDGGTVVQPGPSNDVVVTNPLPPAPRPVIPMPTNPIVPSFVGPQPEDPQPVIPSGPTDTDGSEIEFGLPAAPAQPLPPAPPAATPNLLSGWAGTPSGGIVDISNRYTVSNTVSENYGGPAWRTQSSTDGLFFRAHPNRSSVAVWLTKSSAPQLPTATPNSSNNYAQRSQTLNAFGVDLSTTPRMLAGAVSFATPYSATLEAHHPPTDPEGPMQDFRALYFNWGTKAQTNQYISAGDYLQIWYPSGLGIVRGICHFHRSRQRFLLSFMSSPTVYTRNGDLRLKTQNNGPNPDLSYNWPEHAPTAQIFDCNNFRWNDSGGGGGASRYPLYHGPQAGYNMATNINAPVVDGQSSTSQNLNVLFLNRAYLETNSSNWQNLWVKGNRFDRNGDPYNLICLMFDRSRGLG